MALFFGNLDNFEQDKNKIVLKYALYMQRQF